MNYLHKAFRTLPLVSNRYPCQVWLFFLIFFLFLLWTVVPLLSGYPPGLDAIEMHSWSLAPQWGYYKHPPLPAWVVACSEWLFGKTYVALILPSTASIAITYWAIWHLGKKILTPRLAIVAVFLSSTCLFYHLWATSFNHDVVQIPLWAWSVALFYDAIHSPRTRDWIALGLVFGFALLAKYTAVLLIPPALLFLAFTPSARHYLKPLSLFSFIIAAALIFGPHLIWLVQHDFQPFNYLSTRLAVHDGQHYWIRGFTSFIGMTLLANCLLLIVFWPRPRCSPQPFSCPTDKPSICATAQTHSQPVQNRFLLLLGLGPVLLALLVGLAGATLEQTWAMGIVPLFSLVLVNRQPTRALFLYQRRWLVVWFIFQLLMASAFLIKGSAMYTQLFQGSARVTYPAQAITQGIVSQWQASFPGKKLRYVAGPIWDAGIVSFYASDTPQVLVDGDFSKAPWISKEAINTCGIVLLYPNEATRHTFPAAQIQAPLVIPATVKTSPDKEITWAISPPQGNCL